MNPNNHHQGRRNHNHHRNNGNGGGWGRNRSSDGDGYYSRNNNNNNNSHPPTDHNHDHRDNSTKYQGHYYRHGGGGAAVGGGSSGYTGNQNHGGREIMVETPTNSKRPAIPTTTASTVHPACMASTSSAATTTAPMYRAEDATQKRQKTTDVIMTTETAPPPPPPMDVDGDLADLLRVACKIPPDEQANKDDFLACLRDIDKSLDYVNDQAHQLPKGWKETKQAAAERTIEALGNLRRQQENDANYDYDSDESDPFGRTTANSAPTVGLSAAEKNFIRALPYCIPLSSGFHVIRPNASNICYCPCGPNLKPWRDRYQIHVNLICGNHVTKFTPNALMDHLKEEGGIYQAKKKFVPLRDIYHHATKIYLQNLFADWFGRGFAHKALYPPLSSEHNRAVSEEIRRIERAVIDAEREKKKAQEEKQKVQEEKAKLEKALSVLDEDRRKAVESRRKAWENVEKLRVRLNVEKNDKKEVLSDQRLARFKTLASNYFERNKKESSVRANSVVKFEVKSVRGCNVGFSLQSFFDDIYDSKKKYSTSSMTASVALFKDNSDKNVAKAILSKWNIVYDNQGDTMFESKASKIEGTAVDQGGPSRQFLTDIFKQVETLSVKGVKLFATSDSGVTVVKDEVLKLNISRAMNRSGVDDEEVQAVVKQAKDYVRALGRIILHSMANNYIIPAKALPPFFMTVMFHGYDESYPRADILKHIGLSLSSAFFDGEGNKVTPESFFDKYIPEAFIHSRKMLLGSLRDGLTIGGCSSLEASTVDDLTIGCGMAHDLFFPFPLEAIHKIYFSMLTFNVEDLLAIIVPVYGEEEHSGMSLTMEYKAELIQKQETFFNGDFKRYLRESAKEDNDFLVKFVECVTGSNYLPYDGSHRIQIEFSFARTDGLPLFHSCTRDLVIPGYDYYWEDYKDFKEVKMNQTIDMVYNQFAMK